MANRDTTTSPRHSHHQDTAPPTTSAERVALAAEGATQSSNRLTSLERSHSASGGTQAEKNRRRAQYKTEYNLFAEAAEDRRQKVGDLIAQNDRWEAATGQNEKAIVDGVGADVARLTAENEAMRNEKRRVNREMRGVVDEAKKDIEVQRNWDAFFELRSDEPAV
ncbi:hypothetical protein B0A55_08595 [Friedmanniomyces simplex]|uniref:Uncharacterized protein n=1 Tax=Friedmanniomyces simplex TaxID=329884 RepID=A0A4U0WY35_9PEZI|nr:hypothetical protein B0A55_08595 [Friedmanniomyces simplex]